MAKRQTCRCGRTAALLGAALVLGLKAVPAWAQDLKTEDLKTEDVSKMSLEQLMSVEVTSVSGEGEEWFKTPAAVYVISNDEIRRSGLRTLAEALRLVPGVFVGQTGSSSWSIGMRGFNGTFSDKTLVMIDGRKVYDPEFSGTFWDVQDVLLEDVDRIEVIRGPGATLWGANAVNGVISVTTRSAKDTQGVYAAGGGGTGSSARGFGEGRYGGQIDDDTWFRVWGKFAEYPAMDLPGPTGPSDNHDAWGMAHGGFRIDRESADHTDITLQGEVYSTTHEGERIQVPVPTGTLVFKPVVDDGVGSGADVLMRIKHEDETDKDGWAFQAYYDHTDRGIDAGLHVTRNTVDLDFRNHFQLFEGDDLMWGLGADVTNDQSHSGPTIQLDPDARTLLTASSFLQDTLTLLPKQLFLMLGSKLEWYTYTGFEVEPSGRLWWTPNDKNTLWAAISRPVRMPSRVERDGDFLLAYADSGLLAGKPPTGVIVPIATTGNPGAQAEELLAYEVGYRIAPLKNLTFDTSLYWNDYQKLLYVPTSANGPFNDNGYGESYGAEVAVTWRVSDQWKLIAGYDHVDVRVHGPINNQDEFDTPHNQAQLRSTLDITKDLELNSSLYYVDHIAIGNIPSHFRLDVGMTWRPVKHVEVSVWGQNLTDPLHPEFGAPEVQRAVYGMLTLRF